MNRGRDGVHGYRRAPDEVNEFFRRRRSFSHAACMVRRGPFQCNHDLVYSCTRMAARHHHHEHRVAHFLFPVIIWTESIWVFFGTLSFIAATFFILGNAQDFTVRTLTLLVSIARVSGLLCAVFALAYLVLTAVFRAGGGPRRFGHILLAGTVLLFALAVTVVGFALDAVVRPLS